MRFDLGRGYCTLHCTSLFTLGSTTLDLLIRSLGRSISEITAFVYNYSNCVIDTPYKKSYLAPSVVYKCVVLAIFL